MEMENGAWLAVEDQGLPHERTGGSSRPYVSPMAVCRKRQMQCRFLHLTDSLVALHALSRGRSSS